MSSIISSSNDHELTAMHGGNTARASEPTVEPLAALPTLILLVPCLLTGIWLLISN